MENNSDFKPKNTQLEFKEVEAQNALNLKYQLLDVENMKVSFSSLKVLPEFPGGLDSLYIFIKKNFEFPQNKLKKIEGKLNSTFIVDTSGKVVDVKIIKGLRNDYDSATYKVISKIPDWKPAKLKNGEKVKVKFLLPFIFIMDK